MVLASRRPRTVLGCLVARRDPVRLSWSWCQVAAGGLVGWRASLVRAWLPVWSWVAPGLAVPPPPGRAGSLSRVSWPGGRARVARSPALPRGARSPSGSAPAAGRASARPPTGRCKPGRRRSRAAPRWRPSGSAGRGTSRSGCRRPAAGTPRPRRPREGRFPCALASLGPGLGEVQVLDHDRPRAVLFRGGDQAADRGPQPPVPGRRRAARPGPAGPWPGCRGRSRPPRPRRRRGARR